jgi:type VI secretion system protein ImpC
LLGVQSPEELLGDWSRALNTLATIKPWQELRNLQDARFITLTLPRFLGRLPYSGSFHKIVEFDFEERVEGPQDCLWINSAFALGANIARSFLEYGWSTAISGFEGVGRVDNLPSLASATDRPKGLNQVEASLDSTIGLGLQAAGLTALCELGEVAFIAAPTLATPLERNADSEYAHLARLAVELPYILAVSRFVQYLRCIVRDKIGGFGEVSDMEQYLSAWLNVYVSAGGFDSEESLARHPLSNARITISANAADPSRYTGLIVLAPRYANQPGVGIEMRVQFPSSAL